MTMAIAMTIFLLSVYFLIVLFFFITLYCYKIYETFNNVNTNANANYPCRVFLSDKDFLKHMIPHHQMAIDISIQHIKNTKTDIIMKVLRELIWTQKYEIAMMFGELKHKTDNVSEITNNQPFIPTVSSFIYPNVIGLTNTYCDPSFFSLNTHHNPNHKIMTDRIAYDTTSSSCN